MVPDQFVRDIASLARAAGEYAVPGRTFGAGKRRELREVEAAVFGIDASQDLMLGRQQGHPDQFIRNIGRPSRHVRLLGQSISDGEQNKNFDHDPIRSVASRFHAPVDL